MWRLGAHEASFLTCRSVFMPMLSNRKRRITVISRDIHKIPQRLIAYYRRLNNATAGKRTAGAGDASTMHQTR